MLRGLLFLVFISVPAGRWNPLVTDSLCDEKVVRNPRESEVRTDLDTVCALSSTRGMPRKIGKCKLLATYAERIVMRLNLSTLHARETESSG